MQKNSAYIGRQVVLVDEQDTELGTADIFEAHRGKGIKHRALSVILYRKKNGKTELLLQQRAETKPVFKLLWSNTCCTNMRVGDDYLPRAVTRLSEEMGITIKQEDLRILYRFSYEAPDLAQPGWCENEVDTVIVGEWDGVVVPHQDEAADYNWIEWETLTQDIAQNQDLYAPWYKLIIRDQRFIEGIYVG